MVICEVLGIGSQRGLGGSGRSRLPLIPAAVHEWEAQLSINAERTSMPYRPTQPISYRKPLRNCAVCAAQCYHSWLYQYEWVTKCPLHHETISTSCPSCRQPWPKAGELRTRRCACCSARLSPSVLATSGAFQQIKETGDFDTVAAALEQYKERSGVSVFAQHAGENQFRIHDELPASHLNWPSLIAHKNPPLLAAFKHFGVHLFPVAERTFTLDFDPLLVTTGREIESCREAHLSKTFESDLKRRLEAAFGAQATDRFARIDYKTFSIPKVAAACLRYWNIAVHENRSGKRLLSMCEDDLTFKKMIGFPDSPCLMTHLGCEFTKVYTRPSDLSWNAYPGGLPQDIQEWLYQCDLWWTFVCMFRAILQLTKPCVDDSYSPWNGSNWPLQELPWSRARYLILRGEDGHVTIRVPAWVSRVSFNDTLSGSGHFTV
jgi:hypothetical protein